MPVAVEFLAEHRVRTETTTRVYKIGATAVLDDAEAGAIIRAGKARRAGLNARLRAERVDRERQEARRQVAALGHATLFGRRRR